MRTVFTTTRTAPLLLGAWLALAGCSTVYSRTIDQGDEAAALGKWDDAATYYQHAADIEPEEKEAQGKLKNAHKHQALERLRVGKAALANGHGREALKPLFEAQNLDPTNAEARQAFTEACAAVIAEARKELDAGNLRQSLLVVRDVLAIVPTNADALEVEGKARTKLAEESITKGQAFEKDGKNASALLEYAEALVMRPDNSTAIGKVTALRQDFQGRVTFNVALGKFDGDPQADNLGSSVGPEDIARGLSTTYLIRVTDKPPAKQAYTLAGMRLGGEFRGYKYRRDSQRSQRACDYICGTELVSNPPNTAPRRPR